MSLSAIARDFAERRDATLVASEHGTGTTRRGASSPIAAAGAQAEQLTKYIPAEVVGGYAPVVAAAQDASAAILWLLFWIFFVLTPLVQYSLVVAERAKTKPRRNDFPFYPLLASVIAYVAWAIALPGSIFMRTFGWPNWTGLVAVAVSIILIQAASRIDATQSSK